MTHLDEYIHSFIKRIRSQYKSKKFVFVNDYSACEFPNPLTQNLVVVSILGTDVYSRFFCSRTNDTVYTVTVRFRLYAQSAGNTDSLISLCYELCTAIFNSADKVSINSLNTSAIAFDGKARAVYRDITAQLEFCMYEEDVN